ncbi:MAG: ribonuclease III [Bacteriovoracaceae bacterium]|nr:ribonuclease III [Bacteriovoracaceae bacterium]
MQETTFNSAIQADGFVQFPNSTLWLNQFYIEASLKKIDQSQINYLILQQISFQQLEQNIFYSFKNKNLLIHSLTQSTFCYEMGFLASSSNERLEFIGDSLLNLIVSKKLFHLFTDSAEGELSKLRGALVNEEKLAELARSIGLGDYLFLGRGEFKSEGSQKDSLLADSFESLIAAIFLDSNEDLKVCENIFDQIVLQYEKSANTKYYSLMHLDLFDPKSALQELTMSHHGMLPVYQAVELSPQMGFLVQVKLGEKILGEMTGVSKKKVEKLLARKMIQEKRYL